MNLLPQGVAVVLVAAIAAGSAPLSAQDPQDSPNLVFRSTVDVVSVTAVVRDRRHRVVTSLTREDLQVIDAGEPQAILDFRTEASAPASVALLVDGSGSMKITGASQVAKKIAGTILNSLDPSRDDAALMVFDRRLVTIHGFTHDFGKIRNSLDTLESFGMTSLYDAIAGTAGLISDRSQNRRAVVVLTDGTDTGSAYSPEQVSRIASSIDVPVYIFALGHVPTDADGRAVGALRDLVVETGGDVIIANTPRLVDAGIGRLVEELRHQYLISFRANSFDGLRRVQVRATRENLTVRTRAWYFAGGEQ